MYEVCEYQYVCKCACTHLCVCACRGQKLTSDVSLTLLNLLVETWTLTEPGTHLLARLAGPVSSRICLSPPGSAPPLPRVWTYVSLPGFLHRSAKDLHSGPHVLLQAFSLLCRLLSPTIPVLGSPRQVADESEPVCSVEVKCLQSPSNSLLQGLSP